MNYKVKKTMRLDHEHEAIAELLREALYRIEFPQQNFKGYPMQAGGAWWRLQQVMGWLAPHVEAAGDSNVFEIHGHPETLV